jgi:Carboxypeptidase regulatory-like domain
MSSRFALLLILETAVLLLMAWLVLDHDPSAVVDARERVNEAPGEAASIRATSDVSVTTDPTSDLPERTVVPSNTGPLLLFGCVVDPRGQPIPEAEVYVRDVHGISRANVHNNGDGGYVVLGITPGDWNLSAHATGFRRRATRVTVSGRAPQTRVDIEMVPAVSITVRARTPDGQPLRAALQAAKLARRAFPNVVAFTHPLPESFPLSRRGNNSGLGVGVWRPRRGAGRTDGQPADDIGQLELQVDPPVYVGLAMRQVVLQSKALDRGQTEIIFEVAPESFLEQLGSIRMRVVSATLGRPLEGARISLSGNRIGDGSMKTGRDGVFSRSGVPPGIWGLGIRAMGHARFWRRIRVVPGRELDLGDIAMHADQTLRGVILGVGGKPTKATIRWDFLDGHTFPQALRNDVSTSSNAAGEFAIGVASGRYVIHAFVRREAAAHVIVDTSGVAPSDLRIVLQPTIPVQILNHVPRHECYLVKIRSRDGVPVWGDELRGGANRSLWLPQGECVVDVFRGLELVRSLPLIVKVGAKLRID